MNSIPGELVKNIGVSSLTSMFAGTRGATAPPAAGPGLRFSLWPSIIPQDT